MLPRVTLSKSLCFCTSSFHRAPSISLRTSKRGHERRLQWWRGRRERVPPLPGWDEKQSAENSHPGWGLGKMSLRKRQRGTGWAAGNVSCQLRERVVRCGGGPVSCPSCSAGPAHTTLRKLWYGDTSLIH